MRSLDSIRPLLSAWGKLIPQPASDWTGSIALPIAISDLYSILGPSELMICAGGNPVDIPTLKNLWSFQNGYRWHGMTGERLPGWKENWLVIAKEGANPFIFDTENGNVYFDIAGGKFEPKLFSTDLITALGAIATVANTLSAMGDDAYHDDSELTTQARSNVIASLNSFLSNSNAPHAVEMLEAWQWYT